MQSNDLGPLPGQDVSEGEPTTSAFSLFSCSKFIFFQFLNQVLHAGPIVP